MSLFFNQQLIEQLIVAQTAAPTAGTKCIMN
jgi:hypothetical protein